MAGVTASMTAAGSNPKGTAPLFFTEPKSGELAVRRWRIEVTSGPDLGRVVERDSGSILVGSHADADLPLTDDAVSRRHVELQLLFEGVLAIDLGSTNGTMVGHLRVDRALIPPLGQLRLGRTVLTVSPIDAKSDGSGEALRRLGDFITTSASVGKMLARLESVARTDATVLIEGETGTGKELIARAIHASSPRAAKPFIVVDCGAVNEGVLESQLFGHVKGAFTGAVVDRQGAFEAAQGGTVFLDELGELPVDLQPKLLRVLEARTVRRVGDVVDRPIDVRFVAATNRDLEAMRKEKHFRDDLFFRVAVVRSRIPPLRERVEDIAVLARHSVERLSAGRSRLDPRAVSALELYPWPGNGRELRNVIERAVALSKSDLLGPEDLFPEDCGGPPPAPQSFHEAKDHLVAEFERRYVQALLARHSGNVSSASREAGLSRTAMYALLKRVGIDPSQG